MPDTPSPKKEPSELFSDLTQPETLAAPTEQVTETIQQSETEKKPETERVSQEVSPRKPETDTAAQKRIQKTIPPRPAAIPQTQDEMTLEVEKVLEEGLKDAFQALPPVKQQEFKLKGEQTARAIRDMLRSSKVKVKKIFVLIVEWLKILPGVNKFFLEQEAKIKADRIMAIKKKFRG